MATSSKRVRNVRPDALDFRDLPFRPNVAVAPQPRLFPSIRLPVKDQRGSNACTGFALARVVEQLLRRARRPAARVSPYMLYSMARRYDEFPGSTDDGSSLRGGLKGWFKHGACVDGLWRTGVEMPPRCPTIRRRTGGSTPSTARSARTTASPPARSPTSTVR